MEAETLSLSCRNCGATLRVTRDMSIARCLHCDSQFKVNTARNAVWLSALEQNLERMEAGTDNIATEMALERLSGEAAELAKHVEWLQQEMSKAATSYERALAYEGAVRGRRIGLIISVICWLVFAYSLYLGVRMIASDTSSGLTGMIVLSLIGLVGAYQGSTMAKTSERTIAQGGGRSLTAAAEHRRLADELRQVRAEQEAKQAEYDRKRATLRKVS